MHPNPPPRTASKGERPTRRNDGWAPGDLRESLNRLVDSLVAQEQVGVAMEWERAAQLREAADSRLAAEQLLSH